MNRNKHFLHFLSALQNICVVHVKRFHRTLLRLQNMAFQADQKVKVEIVRGLGTEQLFRLLSDPDGNVLMKTLGLLRNLLSTRPVRERHTHTRTG